MKIDEILDMMDELLDKATSVPFTNKKSLVDVEQLREYIDSIRYNIPSEIQTARAIASDRSQIIADANADAEEIIKKAEERAKVLVSQEEVYKQAEAAAKEITQQARVMDANIKKAMIERLNSILTESEKAVEKSLSEIRHMQDAVNQAAKKAQSEQ